MMMMLLAGCVRACLFLSLVLSVCLSVCLYTSRVKRDVAKRAAIVCLERGVEENERRFWEVAPRK